MQKQVRMFHYFNNINKTRKVLRVKAGLFIQINLFIYLGTGQTAFQFVTTFQVLMYHVIQYQVRRV